MRRISHPLRWAFALLLGLLVCGPAAAERHERKRLERAEISTLEAQWRRAQLAEDITTMDKLLADEFLGVTASGQVVTKAQQLDRMRTRKLDLTRLDVLDTKIKISGNLAVVTSLAQLDGQADGAPFRGSFRYTRVYQRVGRGAWKITNFEATRVNLPVEGPLSPPPFRAPGGAHATPSAAAPSSSPTSRAVSSSQPPPS